MSSLSHTLSRYWLGLGFTALASIVCLVTNIPIWVVALILVLSSVWLFNANKTNNEVRQLVEAEKQRRNQNNIQKSIAFLQNASDLQSHGLVAASKDIALLQDIIRDSAVKLEQSFSGLSVNSKDQESILVALIDRMSAGGDGTDSGAKSQGLKEFTQEMGGIVDYFIGELLSTSQESMMMVHKIDDMAVRMTEVEGLVSDVRTIADQTNLLALNAAIEAARAGEAGRGFAVVADEVRKLSQHSNDFSEQISTVVDKALKNIEEAKGIITKMASKDMNRAIQSKSSVQNMLEDIKELDLFLTSQINVASDITSSITDNVSQAVMSLQFEDRATQLIRATNERLTLLNDVSGTLKQDPDAVVTGQRSLSQLTHSLELLKDKLNQVSSGSDVNNCGGDSSVDLF